MVWGFFAAFSECRTVVFLKKRQIGMARARQEKFPELIYGICPWFGGIWDWQGIQKLLEQEMSPGKSVGSESPSVATQRGSTGIILGFVLPNNCSLFPHHVSILCKTSPCCLMDWESQEIRCWNYWDGFVVFIENRTFNTEEFPFFGPLSCCLNSLDLHIQIFLITSIPMLVVGEGGILLVAK